MEPQMDADTITEFKYLRLSASIGGFYFWREMTSFLLFSVHSVPLCLISRERSPFFCVFAPLRDFLYFRCER